MIARTRAFVGFIWTITRGRILVGIVLNILASLTEGISLFLLIPLLTLVGQDQSGGAFGIPVIGSTLERYNPGLELLLVGFVVLIALQAVFVRAKTLYLTRIMHEALDGIRQVFFDRIGAARWEIIQQKRVADLNTILTTEASRIQLTALSLTGLIQSVIMLTTYFVIALLVSWQMAIFAAVIGAGILAALYPIRKRSTVFGRQLSPFYENQNRSLLEFLTGIRVVKSFVAEPVFSRRYAREMALLREHSLRYAALTSAGTLAFQLASAIAAALFIWVAVKVASLEIAQLIVLLLIFLRLAPRFGAIQESLQQFLSNLPAFEKVQATSDFLAQSAEQNAWTDRQTVPRFRDGIRLVDVSLTYPEAARPALAGISLTIRAGQVTALIGPSGSGKSTIADLVMGLLRPTAGEVYIDDDKLTDDNRRAWRGSVAFVPQEPFLLHDTIRANLQIARPDADEVSLWAALKQARADEFVARLSQGLDTIVGERGTRLSGGERQRIALARALLCEPELLILDEATSALDWENQQMIAADIENIRGRITIVTIAHRPSMIRFADWVIAIEDGRCVEEGAFDDLAQAPDSRLAMMLKGEGAQAH
ncbi:MAG: ABC transporter ATP-binding protein [Erythrobacter sp.]